MPKKFLAGILALGLVFGLQTAALAEAVFVPSYKDSPTGGGFSEQGGFTDTNPAYYFNTDLVYLVYNKELDDDPDFTEIYTGSDIYIAIYRYYDQDGKDDQDAIATAKQIKEDNIQVQYKGIKGAQYIDNVTIVDGKKEKITGLPAGSYAKVDFSDKYAGTSSTDIQLRMVLSMNKVSYQETRIMLEGELTNRLEYIDDDSVYGAMVPTRYRVQGWYTGYATFDMGDGVKYTARVAKGARYSIDFSRDVDYDIDMMYPDANMEFYNFRGNNDTFASVGALTIPINEKVFKDADSGQPRVYAYEILESGGLRALGSDSAGYDSKKKILTINAKTLGSYVLSNQKLKQTVDSEANDTFQSGYAADEEVEPAQEASLSSNRSAASSSQSSSRQSSSQAASSRASSTAQASQVAASSSQEDIDDRPVSVGTDQPDTGGITINAANRSGDNPDTRDGLPGAPAIALLGGMCCAALLADHRKK